MRHSWLALLTVAVAGCHGGAESEIAGTWKVEPASIQFGRLAVGADQKQEWADARNTLGGVQMTFSSSPKEVIASGLGMTAKGTWKLSGDTIGVEGKGEWPKLTFDAKANRIHLKMERNGEVLAMDLAK